MSVPNWYELILLALAAYRTWMLLAKDDALNWPRRYVTRLSPNWKKDGDPVGKDYRDRLASFIDCPWCLGFWLALGWWGLWQAWPHGALIATAPLAISAVLALVESARS